MEWCISTMLVSYQPLCIILNFQRFFQIHLFALKIHPVALLCHHIPKRFQWIFHDERKWEKIQKKCFHCQKTFFFLFRLESNCFAATAKENMLCYMRCILGDYLLNKSFYECSFLFCQQRKPWKNRHRSHGFPSGNEIRRHEGNEESSGIGYLRCFLVFLKNVCTKLVTTNGNTNLDLVHIVVIQHVS